MDIIEQLLLTFFNKEWALTAIIIVLSFAINFFQMNGISLMSAKIIQSIEKNDSKKAYEFFQYFIGITLLYVSLYNVYYIQQNKLMTTLRQWLRQELINTILNINSVKFSEVNFANLSIPIIRLSNASFSLMNSIITFLLPNITLLLVITGYFIYKNIFFGLFFILSNIVIVMYVIFNWEQLLNDKINYEKTATDNDSRLIEILNNLEKIIYRGETKNEMDDVSKRSDNVITKGIEFYMKSNFIVFACNIAISIVTFFAIYYLIYLFFNKSIDNTTFISFFTILILYRDKFLSTLQIVPEYLDYLSRGENLKELFKDMNDDYNNIKNNKYKSVNIPFNVVRFENVSFKYKSNDNSTLSNFNKTVDLNDKIIGVTGVAGKGKSTFAKLILKMYHPDEGKIYIDNVCVDEMDGEYIRKNISYVNQNSKLFDKIVVENMLYGCDKEDICHNYLAEILKYDKIGQMFGKMDIHEKKSGLLGENLSGGQRQVINIIGGLIQPSEIVILDEPTNSLDIDLKHEIINLIKNFKKYKKCIIIITHDKDVFPIFDENIKM